MTTKFERMMLYCWHYWRFPLPSFTFWAYSRTEVYFYIIIFNVVPLS